MKTAIIGYPYVSEHNGWIEMIHSYINQNLTQSQLLNGITKLQMKQLKKQRALGIDVLTIGDFPILDRMLDMAYMFNMIPQRFKMQHKRRSLQLYFDMANGYTATACETTSWFSTNYQYYVPEYEGQKLQLKDNFFLKPIKKCIDEFGVSPRVTMIGPYTFMKLTKGINAKNVSSISKEIIGVYNELLHQLEEAGVEWIQLEEPYLAYEYKLSEENLLNTIYTSLCTNTKSKIMVTVPYKAVFNLEMLLELPVAGVGLDFVNGFMENMNSLQNTSWPASKVLAIGIVDGLNIWRTDLHQTLEKVKKIQSLISQNEIWIQGSCSFLHVPVTKKCEDQIFQTLYNALAFADEKIKEIVVLKELLVTSSMLQILQVRESQKALQQHPSRLEWEGNEICLKKSKKRVHFGRRWRLQQLYLELSRNPKIISKSYINDVARGNFNVDDITEKHYLEDFKSFFEPYDIDIVLYAMCKNEDIVPYFAEHLRGVTNTKAGWIVHKGTECIKPAIIYGNVKREGDITATILRNAQKKLRFKIKGMIPGPNTFINRCFYRDDIDKREILNQVSQALLEEIKAVEQSLIYAIQIEEFALFEKLPFNTSMAKIATEEAMGALNNIISNVRDMTLVQTNLPYSTMPSYRTALKLLQSDIVCLEMPEQDIKTILDLKKRNYKFHLAINSNLLWKNGEIDFENANQIKCEYAGIPLWINIDKEHVQEIKNIKKLM